MKLIKKLKNLTNIDDLEKYVINYIFNEECIKNDDDLKMFFQDLSRSGCQSCMISTLIYYSDTKQFYNDFESEICDLVDDLENEFGPIKTTGNLKSNFYSWLAFEETARRLANRIGLEY